MLERPPITIFVEGIEEYDNATDVKYHPQNNNGWLPIFTVKARISTLDEFRSSDFYFRARRHHNISFRAIRLRCAKSRPQNFILELNKPPTSSLKIGNIYVMLSRASSWDDVAILRLFNESIFHGALNFF